MLPRSVRFSPFLHAHKIGTLSLTQVIAPYLITLRVARRQALANDVTVSESGSSNPIYFRGRGTEDSDRVLLGGGPGTSMVNGGVPEPSAGAKNKALLGQVPKDP